MESAIKITVIILTYKRINLIKNCLKSIIDQNDYSFEIEVLVLVNGKDEETTRYLEEITGNNQLIKFTALEKETPVGEARNILIKQAKGDFLCFLDDDITLPTKYFKQAELFLINNSEVDIFGGPDQTGPYASDFQQVLGAVMETFMAMGPTVKRHSSKDLSESISGNEINLILCNLWIRKSVLSENDMLFPAGYIRNEENILLAKLEQKNKRLIYLPSLFVFHERKNSYNKLIRATYLSGKYRVIGFFDEFATFHVYFLIPLFAFIIFWYTLFFEPLVFVALVSIYYVVIFLHSVYVCKKVRKPQKIPTALMLYLVYNFIYPVGMISGFFKRLKN